MSKEYIRPGQLAYACAVDPCTIRNWEAAGRIPKAERTLSGYRRWPLAQAVAIVQRVGRSIPKSWGVVAPEAPQTADKGA